MRTLIATLAAGMIWLTPSADAQQQKDRDAGLWCVYDALTDTLEYEQVAEAYLFEGDTTGDPGGVLAKAGAACRQTHGLSETQMIASEEYGRLGSAIDYLTEDLLWEGATDEEISAIFDVSAALNEDDFSGLYETDWKKGALGGRIKAQLLAASFPDDAYFLDTAMSVLELIALAHEAEFVYFIDELAEEDAN